MQKITIEVMFKEGNGYDLDSEELGDIITGIGYLEGVRQIDVFDNEGNSLLTTER